MLLSRQLVKSYELYIYIFIIGFLVSCTNNDKKNDQPLLIEPVAVSDFEDNPEFSQFKLTCIDSGLLVTDYNSNRIHLLGYNDLDVIKSIGQKGRGPAEFNGIYLASESDGEIFISDAGNQLVHVLDSAVLDYITSIPIQLSSTRFSVLTDYIYSSTPISQFESTLMKIDLKSGSVTYFGERDIVSNRMRNMYHVVTDGKKIYSVSYTEPIIKIYDLDGAMKMNYDLQNEDIRKSTIDFANRFYNQEGNESRVVVMNQDAIIENDTLIIKVLNHEENAHSRNSKYNGYSVYRVKDLELSRVGSFRTNIGNGGISDTFCAKDGYLYSNGGQNRLNIFKFKIPSDF